MITQCRRFLASRDGLAAIEFAMIAPMLLLLLLATFDAGRAMAAYMKIRAAAFNMATIANQYATGTNGIQSTDMTAITGSASLVLSPFKGPVTAKITQIKALSASTATVSWSYALNGTPYPNGSSWTGLPAQFATTNACGSYPCYYLFAEASYTYTPSFGAFITGPITLADSLYVTPRVSACVQYINTPSAC